MTPTLIVPGPAEDWVPLPPTGQCRCIGQCHGGHTWSLGAPPLREWVPVTTLPAVPSDEWVSEDRGGGYSEIVAEPRPLRAGDTVELRLPSPVNLCGDAVFGDPEPFATAEVAEVLPITDDLDHPTPCALVASGRVSVHPDQDTWAYIDIPGAQPGGWAVRLTHVEALSGHVDSAVTPEEAQALRVESINERHARLRAPRH